MSLLVCLWPWCSTPAKRAVSPHTQPRARPAQPHWRTPACVLPFLSGVHCATAGGPTYACARRVSVHGYHTSQPARPRALGGTCQMSLPKRSIGSHHHHGPPGVRRLKPGRAAAAAAAPRCFELDLPDEHGILGACMQADRGASAERTRVADRRPTPAGGQWTAAAEAGGSKPSVNSSRNALPPWGTHA